MNKKIELHIPLLEYEALPVIDEPLCDNRDFSSLIHDSSIHGSCCSMQLIKKSIDARKKKDIRIVISLLISDEKKVLAENNRTHSIPSNRNDSSRPVVIGFGPAGIFCALTLARSGRNPIVIERGASMTDRIEDVNRFSSGDSLKLHSNIQFGEGGAGTFSDGKLFSGISDGRKSLVLQEFVNHGASPSILFDAHPHIGTDVLQKVVVSMREEIIRLGGKVLFERNFTSFSIEDGHVASVTHCDAKTNQDEKEIPCDELVIALGHSSRDTFRMLHNANVTMEAKPFAVGVRIEHLQTWIDEAQYGACGHHPLLHPANYKAVASTKTRRKLFTFCMCPGGVVVPATSYEGGVVTNGMSYFARDKENANSALLVGVNPDDFSDKGVLGGILFQEELERRTFCAGGSNYFAPAQTWADFRLQKSSTAFGQVKPSYRPGVVPANLWNVLPNYVCETILDGIPEMAKRIHGFDCDDAVLTAVESRSSSPVRILRGDNMQSISHGGIYPCGEGAGYAGGIMSSAIDGIKAAEAILAHESL
ncbi:MAG TPA: hypothetical protein PK567_06845 [Bacillota bacterium]|nr:hypothetical protein [Bacillota bacterium]